MAGFGPKIGKEKVEDRISILLEKKTAKSVEKRVQISNLKIRKDGPPIFMQS